MDWKIFLRQLLIGSGPCCLHFVQGLSVGLPTVLVPQLRKANYTISDELASWLPTTQIYSGIPTLFMLAALVVAIGRKKSHIIACISSLMGFVIFYFSTSVTHFLIGEVFQGALFAASLSSSIFILTEFMSSKYRGFFLTLKTTTYFWGILVSNATGTFFHWQNITIMGIICSIYTLVTVAVWPESPLWLASKGKFEECAAAHRWLKGKSEESEKELQILLKFHKNIRCNAKQKVELNVFRTICQKTFKKILLLTTLLICLHAFSGKLACTIYSIDILKKITNSHSTAYTGMLILDSVTVCSMYLGCFLSRVCKRRIMLIGFTVVSVIFMISISLYLYLAKLSVIDENKYVSIILLSGYSISISLGPMVLVSTITSELLPLKNRTLAMLVVALTVKSVSGTFVKISPFLYKTFAMHGTFALYAVLTIINLILIFFFLPETKDKTLQEITDSLMGVNNEKTEEVSEMIKQKRSNKQFSKYESKTVILLQ